MSLTLSLDLDSSTDLTQARTLIEFRLQQIAALETSAAGGDSLHRQVQSVLDRTTSGGRWLAMTVAQLVVAGVAARGKAIRASHPEHPREGALGAWRRSLDTAARDLGVMPLLSGDYPDSPEVVYSMSLETAQAILTAAPSDDR